MAGSSATQRGRHRHTRKVHEAAQELATQRIILERDWTNSNEDLEEILGKAEAAGARIAESSIRMDVDGATRRVRCAQAMHAAFANLTANAVAVEY